MQLTNSKTLSLSNSSFLYFALFNTFVFLLGLLDMLFLDQKTTSYVAAYINPSFYFVLIGFPHVFGSFLTMFHRNYKESYGRLFYYKIFPVLALALALLIFSFVLYKLLFVFLISFHISGQMVGLNRYFGLKNNTLFKTWKILNGLLFFMGFLMIYDKELLFAVPFLFKNLNLISSILYFLSSISLMFLIPWKANSKNKLYFFLTQVQIGGICYFGLAENLFFWGVLITLSHDLIAFLFYFTHEHNAAIDGNHNHLLKNNIIAPTLLFFLFSIISSFLVAKTLVFFSIPFVMFFFQIAHYVLEDGIWRSGSLHRNYITFREKGTHAQL